MKENFFIRIETLHIADNGKIENVIFEFFGIEFYSNNIILNIILKAV